MESREEPATPGAADSGNDTRKCRCSIRACLTWMSADLPGVVRPWRNDWAGSWCPTGCERSSSRCYQQRPADFHQEDTGAAELVSGPIGDDAEQAEALELRRSSATSQRATEVLREYA